jgi:hypothetical protein
MCCTVCSSFALNIKLDSVFPMCLWNLSKDKAQYEKKCCVDPAGQSLAPYLTSPFRTDQPDVARSHFFLPDISKPYTSSASNATSTSASAATICIDFSDNF